MKNIFLAESNNGTLSLVTETNRFRFQQDLKDHPNAKYRIERLVKKRSLQQNRFFWLYLELIERETGNTTDAMHDYVKKYLTPKKEVSIKILKGDKWVRMRGVTGKGTSELTKLEMGDVLDKLSADTGVTIPDPRELANYISNY